MNFKLSNPWAGKNVSQCQLAGRILMLILLSGWNLQSQPVSASAPNQIFSSEENLTVTGGTVTIVPASPTTNDNIEVIITGQWSSNCPKVDISPLVQIGTTIYIRGTLSNATQFCGPIISNWRVSVPLGKMPAGNYVVDVNIDGGSLYSVADGVVLTVKAPCHTVGAVNPVSGMVGSTVTIIGANFSDVNAVKFSNNVAGNFVLNTVTQITATVPNGAVTGPITVSKTGCPEVQTGTFTVVSPPPRVVRIVNTTASSGSTVSVPIELVAQGDENALGFSLAYNTAILSNSQATLGGGAGGATLITNTSQTSSGRYGIAVSLPTGQKFAAGTKEIVVVVFTVSSNAAAGATIIEFNDQPIAREVVDVNAGALATTWTPGTVTITTGYEADVMPRPSGNNNGTVTIADWVQAGRFAAGLDVVQTSSNEFQRADCAPRPCGDGRISISDWVQAGRYAGGLDPVVAACGSTSSTPSLMVSKNRETAISRVILKNTALLSDGGFTRSQADTLLVELEAQGDENAVGFTLVFDPSVLSFKEAGLGKDAAGATMHVNKVWQNSGRIGMALALRAGEKFAVGKREMIMVVVAVNPIARAGKTLIDFGDQLIPREVVDVVAQPLAATWKSTMVASVQARPDADIPATFALEQNFPNPFSPSERGAFGNPSTRIEFAIPRPVYVTLKIFTLTGQEIATLVDQQLTPGRYNTIWDTSGLNGGVYFYQLKAGQTVFTRKLTVLK